jgi:hypothetical protein
MTLARSLAVGTWLLLAGGSAALAWAVAAPLWRPIATTAASHATPYPAESLGHLALARDLFRADRRPTAVAYDPERGANPASPTPVLSRPTLALTGLVWGPAPEAVIEGLPGTGGPRILRPGEVVAGLRLIRMTPTEVVIVGMDTTWTLTVRDPWR